MYWFYPMEDYVCCFRVVGVKDRGELNSLCKQRYAETDVRDAVDELLQNEENAADFISELDREMKAAEHEQAVSNVLTVGSCVPSELELLDADSSSSVSLATDST